MVRTKAKVERMRKMDYIVVLVRQTMTVAGDSRGVPTDWEDMLARFRPEFDACWDMGEELFGERPCEDGTRLFTVKELTLQESAIAGRMDLTHAEKIELIKPLREKRCATWEARMERTSKWEREYRENRRRREAGREERIAAAGAVAKTVSDEDRIWAQSFGLSLD